MAWTIVNVRSDETEAMDPAPGFAFRLLRLGERIGSHELGASVYELPPGKRTCPYHAHFGNEELLIVLDGRPTLRTEAGEQVLGPGDAAAFRRGRAHQVINRSRETVRFLMISTMLAPDVSLFPDTGKMVVVTDVPPGRKGERTITAFLRGDAHAGWADGEPID
jgi:uncharacterized cupin superfamily protein